MNLTRSILARSNKYLLKVLPGPVYVQLARWIIPTVDSRRRDFSSKVRACQIGYVVLRNGHRFYFHSPFNVGRYLFTKDEDKVHKRLLNKYTGNTLSLPTNGRVVDPMT